MQIHVARDGKEMGSFSLDEVRAGLISGKFLPTDFGWAEGQTDWLRLPNLPGMAPTAAKAVEKEAESKPEPEPPVVAESSLPEPLAEFEPEMKPRAHGWARPLHTRRTPDETSSLARTSLLLGILALSVIPLLPAIPAIICGHLARAQIRRSEGTLGGDGLALCGLITGYLSLFVFGLVGVVIYLVAASIRSGVPLAPQ